MVSAIAAEGMHLIHEFNAMIADDPVAFADAIVRLWTSRTLWERISASGRENVREHFSVESSVATNRRAAGICRARHSNAFAGEREPARTKVTARDSRPACSLDTSGRKN